jgi:hypothetical protein
VTLMHQVKTIDCQSFESDFPLGLVRLSMVAKVVPV